MKPYTPATNKGRTVGGNDIHHRTADQPRKGATASAKAMRHAARQAAAKEIEALTERIKRETELGQKGWDAYHAQTHYGRY